MPPHPNPSAIQEMPFDDLTGIEIRATRLDLVVEGDSALNSVAQLMVEPGTGAPALSMRGSQLQVSQDGRYRGHSPAVLKLPSAELPWIAANISRGNLTLENISASIAINIDSGDLRISGGRGDLAINIASGDVVIQERAGDIACRVSSGNISLSRCQGDIATDVSKGNVDLLDCKGNVALRVTKGDIAILRPIEQDLNIAGGKCDVRIQGGSLASTDINIQRGDIYSTARLRFTEPPPLDDPDDLPPDDSTMEDELNAAVEEISEEVRFNLGNVEFIASDAGVRVSAGGTERFVAGPEGIEIRRADGTPVFRASESGVRVGTASGASGSEQFRFKTGRGNISIDVAEDQPARVELIVNRGNVHSSIPLVEVGRPGPRSTTRRYVGVSDSSETDRILIRALTQRGDINVRSAKASREAARGDDTMSTRDRQRRQILEALAQGKITADEADILLAAMERESG